MKMLHKIQGKPRRDTLPSASTSSVHTHPLFQQYRKLKEVIWNFNRGHSCCRQRITRKAEIHAVHSHRKPNWSCLTLFNNQLHAHKRMPEQKQKGKKNHTYKHTHTPFFLMKKNHSKKFKDPASLYFHSKFGTLWCYCLCQPRVMARPASHRDHPNTSKPYLTSIILIFQVTVRACMLSCTFVSYSLWPHGL